MAQRELTELLLGLQVTQLVITHDLPFALQLCPRSVVIDDGQVVADGATADLLADRTCSGRTGWSCPTASTRATSAARCADRSNPR